MHFNASTLDLSCGVATVGELFLSLLVLGLGHNAASVVLQNLNLGIRLGLAVTAACETVFLRVQQVICNIVQFSEVGKGATVALAALVLQLLGFVQFAECFGHRFCGLGLDRVVTEVEHITRVLGVGVLRRAVQEHNALDRLQWCGCGVDWREERLEDCCGQALQVLGDVLLVFSLLGLALGGAEVVHDKQRRREVLGASTLGSLHALVNVFAETVLLNSETKRRSSGCDGHAQLHVAALAATEKKKV